MRCHGQDVLPDGPGWLAACRRRIAGPLPRVVTAKATVVGGAEAGGYVVGLNDAARMRLGRRNPFCQVFCRTFTRRPTFRSAA